MGYRREVRLGGGEMVVKVDKVKAGAEKRSYWNLEYPRNS